MIRAFFIVVVLLVLAGWHTYLWLRLGRDPAWPRPVRRGLGILFAALALSIPSMFLIRFLAGRGAGGPLVMAGYLWLGAGFLLLSALVFADVVRASIAAVRAVRSRLSDVPPVVPDPARRVFLARSVAAAAVTTTGAATAWGVNEALGEVRVKEVAVRLARLPKALDGLRVVQITDLHVGAPIGRAFVERVAEQTRRLDPDLLVYTGDLVDGRVAQLEHAIEPLGRLSARFGTYAVTGNHEYYSGALEWIEHLAKLGIHTLGNSRVEIGDPGPGGARLDLAGIWDFQGGRRLPDHRPNLAPALRGRDPDRELMLLSHQPKAADMAAAARVGLMLSGHTHGGQLQPFGGLVWLTQPYLAGLHQHGPTQVYVSRGTGFWGPPIRLGAPAEITHVTLVSG